MTALDGELNHFLSDPIRIRAMKYTLVVGVEAICNLCRHVLAKRFKNHNSAWLSRSYQAQSRHGPSGLGWGHHQAQGNYHFGPTRAGEAGANKVWVGERMDFQFQGKCFFIANCAIRSNRGRKGIEIEGCPPPELWIRQGLTSAKTS